MLVLAGQAVTGGMQIGISNDEPVHQERLAKWFTNGWYLPEHFVEHGEVDPDIQEGRVHSYGAGFSLFGHVVAVLTGAETWGSTVTSAEAYAARSVAVALLGLAGALAVGYALLVVTRSRVAAAWSSAATFAMPLWTGYSMFAVKDITAAAGWSMITAGLIAALAPRARSSRIAAVALLCAAGVWFSVGTRTALWAPLAVVALIFAVLVAVRTDRLRLRAPVLAAAGGALAGFFAVVAVHANNTSTPFTWLFSAVFTSGDFHWTGTTLTAGQLVPEKPPWWYLPAWIGGSVPLVLGVLSLAGAVISIVWLRRGIGTVAEAPPPTRLPTPVWLRERLDTPRAGMLLWLAQALLLPTLSTLLGATMYAGMRHHLYVLPAFAALSGLAAWWLLRRYPRSWPTVPVVATLGLAIAVPAAEQSGLYPYNFVYKNALAAPVNDRWETDMHWVSACEALTRVPAGVSAWCYTNAHADPGGTVRAEIRPCAGDRQVAPCLSEQGRHASTTPASGHDWVIGRKYRGTPPPDGCVERQHVTRRLRGEEVLISYVLTCEPQVSR